MKRTALYVRVSTEEQRDHGISIENQLNELKKYCNDNNYIISGIYNDAGISARKSYKKRPALLQLLEDCKNDKIDLIIFTKLDRWFRSIADYYDVQRILDECGVKWRCIWEDYETETSTGVFKVNIMLSVAQSEADRTSERINKVFEYKKARGEVCSGGVAFGYKIVNKKWVKNEDEAPFVDAFFNKYFATFSNREAQKAVVDMGKSISTSLVKKMLDSPAYYGALPYVSESYITKEQHEIIIKSKKRHISNRKHSYIFSGICFCGLCGSRMIGERTINIRKDGSEQHSVRYMCGKHKTQPQLCYGASVRESIVEDMLLEKLDVLLKNRDLNHEYELVKKNIGDPKKKINNLKSKLKRVRDLYELGGISIDEYTEKKNKIYLEINSIEAIDDYKPILLPSNWRDAYNMLDAEHKKVFWNNILTKIVVNGRLSTDIEFYF